MVVEWTGAVFAEVDAELTAIGEMSEVSEETGEERVGVIGRWTNEPWEEAVGEKVVHVSIHQLDE